MKRILVSAWAACTGAVLFAIFYNAFSGSWMIGFDYDSCVQVSLCFGLLTTLGLTVTGAIKEDVGNLRIILTGIATGIVLYLGNVYFGMNAGFTIKGMAVVGLFGGFSAASAAAMLWSVFAPLPKE